LKPAAIRNERGEAAEELKEVRGELRISLREVSD
jgi:hypothetical protein